MPTTQNTYGILPLAPADLPALCAIQESAFANDRHTRMKMAEKGTTDMASELQPREHIAAQLGLAQAGAGAGAGAGTPGLFIKAVDGDGEMVGFCMWREWVGGEYEGVGNPDPTPLSSPVPVPTPTGAPHAHLGAITSNHLATLQSRLNRADTHTLFCTGLSVAPTHQGRGVASALIGHVARVADERRARAWVHLSDQPGGVKALERWGFGVVNELSVDLDLYASTRREGAGKWGVYTFRMLVREPRGEGVGGGL